MRTSDIWQAKQNPFYVRTENMYLDKDKPLDQMSLDELKPFLCGKANGDVLVCESCDAPCKFGRRIMELLKPVEKEEIAMPNPVRIAAGKASGALRHEKSENAYLQAIASGDPKQWFIDNGRDVKNGMVRLKQRFGDMTPEEAKERLAEKGVGIDVLVPAKKPEASAPVDLSETAPVQPEPVAQENVRLQIHSLSGNWFRYTRIAKDEAINIEPNPLCVAYVSDVDAICAEIRAAFEMMTREAK